MQIYYGKLFPKYLFIVIGKELKVFSFFRKRMLKPYYSSFKKKYRYRLKTSFGHFLQFSEAQFKHFIFNERFERIIW